MNQIFSVTFSRSSAHGRINTARGLSLVEVVVGVALFMFVSLAILTTYQRAFQTVKAAQARIAAGALATEQFEIIRNVPYAQVGTQTGIPYGVIPAVQTLSRSGMTFIATTTIRNVDHPFDGTAGSTTNNDLSPADNKSVEIAVTCTNCRNFRPYHLYSYVAPRALESASTNGSLFVQVIDAGALPVQGAQVHVVNTTTVPPVDITDVTSADGMLQIIDAPPAFASYEITVSKPGYSTESTSASKPPATVVAQTVTQITFVVDKVASLDFSSVTSACTAVPNINVRMAGAKLISTSPDVLKYDSYFSTGAGATFNINDVEWDTYTITATSATKDLAGVMPLSPFSIIPAATQAVQLIMAPKDSPAVMVTVKDAGTGLPISGATVTLDDGSASTTLTTGRGFLRQTDWSGGAGQEGVGDETRYFAHDAGIDALSTPGEVRLYDTLGTFAATGELESSTFDTGAVSNFYQFTFLPTAQNPETGLDSVRFQIATGNATSSWTYLGPDGTAASYYTPTSPDIAAVHNGDRYLRYKMFLSTASSTLTPSVSNIGFAFTSACAPPGQVLFQGLANGTYTVVVTKSGYTGFAGSVSVNAGTPWQELSVTLTP